MAATEAPADSYSKASADAKATEQSQQTPTRSHDIESQLVLTTPYSVFGTNAKRNIIALCTLAGLFSPLSAFTYFPALDYMAEDLGVTLQLMNLTITMYLVMQGVVPTILGDLADQVGRRPIYILVLAVYVGANVGLALQRNYTALLILRMLQSAGSSGQFKLNPHESVPDRRVGMYAKVRPRNYLFRRNGGSGSCPVAFSWPLRWCHAFWVCYRCNLLCYRRVDLAQTELGAGTGASLGWNNGAIRRLALDLLVTRHTRWNMFGSVGYILSRNMSERGWEWEPCRRSAQPACHAPI